MKAQLASALLPAERRLSCRYYTSCSSKVHAEACSGLAPRIPRDLQHLPADTTLGCPGEHVAKKHAGERPDLLVGCLCPHRDLGLPPARSATPQQDRKRPPSRPPGPSHPPPRSRLCRGFRRQGRKRPEGDEPLAVPQTERVRCKVPCVSPWMRSSKLHSCR